jgi:hypothetical protein
MDRPIIISKKILDDLDFAGLFPVGEFDMLDQVLQPYLSNDSEIGGLQLVSIVVIQHGSSYLVTEDEGIYSMGFVRECKTVGHGTPSFCNIAVTEAQKMIEYYAPSIKYRMSILGLMQCDQQSGDRQWLACLFLAEINRDIIRRTVGTKRISMRSIEEIAKLLGSEWGLDIATLARACAGIS